MEWLKLAATIAASLVAMLIAVLGWALQKRSERKVAAARWVNPFLMACNDLSSRLYGILERRNLEIRRDEHAKKEYAEETLYLITQYFAWVRGVVRYTNYTQDRKLIWYTELIRDIFATGTHFEPTFLINRSQQTALGQVLMADQMGGNNNLVDTITLYEFQDRLSRAPLVDIEFVKNSLDALSAAFDKESLTGYERIAAVQNILVHLIYHLEMKEGVRLFFARQSEKRELARIPFRENLPWFNRIDGSLILPAKRGI